MIRKTLLIWVALLTAFSAFAGGDYGDGFRAGWENYCRNHFCAPPYRGDQPRHGDTYEDGFADGVEAAARANAESH
jgi:hypothetical protein